jgi:hypothetical protein
VPEPDLLEPPTKVTPLRVYTRRGAGPPPEPLFEAPSEAVRRSTRPHFHPTYLHDYVAHLDSVQAFAHLVHVSDEPLTFQDVATDPLWVQAIAEEMESLSRNQTWTIVDPPPGYRPIAVKRVYKLKSGPTGSATRYKARLVARKDMQKAGIDYKDTFAPVVKWDSLRNIVSLAAQKG